jgi:hypothetical protein
MQTLALPGNNGSTVELDLCFGCQGMWFDPQENLKLAPAAVADLFRQLHEQRDAPRQPLATQTRCPRCTGPLIQGFDVVRSGRYITYRCGKGHGRFSPFSSFMIEKGFVRMLTRPEVEDIAKRVAVIHCTGCGAPVDIRKDPACPHCHSAFSLIDPTAVEKAMQGYAKASKAESAPLNAPDLADALVMLERDRQRALREQQAERGRLFTTDASASSVDLWSLGIALLATVLD